MNYQHMLFLGAILCDSLLFYESRPIPQLRSSSYQQFDCIDGLGFTADEKDDCQCAGSVTEEWVMERDHNGRNIRTKETTTKNRYGDAINKFKIFYVPNFCIMTILKCNCSNTDRCIPGTIKRWQPGFWTVDAKPLSCQTNQSKERHSLHLAKRAPKGAKCFMKDAKNNKDRTPCGSEIDGELVSLEEIVGQSVDYSAISIDNEADLILSRGDGEFHWRDLQLNQQFVCKKHYKELGRDWKRKQPHIRRSKTSSGLKCAMPNLENVRAHEKPAFAKRNTYLSKAESEAIWDIKKVFVPLETALCEYHKDISGDIEAEYRVVRKGYNLRNILPSSLAESPATERAFPSYQRLQQHFACESIDEQREDERTDPDTSIAGQYAKEMAIEGLRQAIIDLAVAAEIAPTAVHFTENFRGLSISSQKRRVQIARKLSLAMCTGFAPDSPEYFQQLLIGKQSLDAKTADIQAKLDNVVQQIVKCFQNSPTGTTKQQALALIAPFFELSEIRAYFPEVTPYYFKRARIFAKTYDPGQQLPPKDTKRRSISEKQLAIAIQFITSMPVIIDLPFGTATATTSAGKKEEVPLVVRMQVNERIYRQYIAYMKESNQMELAVSRSTMLRILQYCTASTRKSLQGLDYFTWAGGEGFSALIELVKKLTPFAQDPDWSDSMTSQLKEARQYLKLDYKLHIKDASRIADHCMYYALSDSTNPAFAVNLNYKLDMRCDRCEALKNAIEDIRSVLDLFPTDNDQQNHEKEEMLYEFDNAVNAIIEMKKHIIRTIRQDQARAEILETLDVNSVFLIVDWAMKHLPVAGRVPQSDWFGQRGLSWHITHTTARNLAGDGYRTRIFVHVFESVAQDSAAIIAILQSVLEQIKKELPHITKAYLRSDNAGCYKSAQTVVAVQEISASTGILIKRWDFSDPQSGKGACDRSAATVKNHIRLYAAENHRCTNAQEFAACVNSYTGIKSVTVLLSEFTPDKKRTLPTIPGITRYNNFEFKYNENSEQSDIIAWQAYKIGPGFSVPQKNWHRKKLLQKLEIIGTFTEGDTGDVNDAAYWKSIASTQQDETVPFACRDDIDEDDDDNFDSEAAAKRLMFPCPEPGCIKTYQSHNALTRHLENGTHKYKPEKISLRDAAIGAYKKELEGLRLQKHLPIVDAAVAQVAEANVMTSALPEGWALRIRQTCTRFSIQQRNYLTEKFDHGAKTGRKLDPKVISKQMRGEFLRTQWLTSTQIAAYWSRLAHSKREQLAPGIEDCGEDGEGQTPGDMVNEETIADDPYFNTVQDDIYDAINENEGNIFQ